MSTSKKEQLHTQTNAGTQESHKENSSSEKLVEREQIGGTPYWVVGNKDQGYMVTFGKWQMTEREETMEKALEYYEKNEVNVVLTTAIILIDERFNKGREEKIAAHEARLTETGAKVVQV